MATDDDITDAINRAAQQMTELPAGTPDWVHNVDGVCSLDCPCDNPRRGVRVVCTVPGANLKVDLGD